MAVPRLSVDRPFTYLLKDEHDAGTGSLVSVPFHGRTVRGWILGPATDPPSARLLPVRRVFGDVRFFDPAMLRLLRWVGERYVAPLTTVIERSHPPRVAGEESLAAQEPAAVPERSGSAVDVTEDGVAVADLLASARVTWLRPLPQQEAQACLAVVEGCVASGLAALVIVPEADPLPETARAVMEAFGHRAVLFAGGDSRERYRTWLDIRAGAYRVVVGTRPAVFAPVAGLGVVWISRENHPGQREDRAPYYHVRDVAVARARIGAAACVLASLCPSAETAAGVRHGTIATAHPQRGVERSAAPLVETAPPEAEDRSNRLTQLLKTARSAVLILSRRGYGIARVCRSCGEPAACAACRGPIVVEQRRPTCRVCGTAGVCAVCGASDFGIERGGTERIAEWASRASSLWVENRATEDAPPGPASNALVVGTAATVKEVGPLRLDLVAILDPDRALARPGLHSAEQSVATWMEAAAWAGPKADGGRVLLQTRQPGHPAIQAVIRWDPMPFLAGEAKRRAEAGFPPGHPIFRIEGAGDLDQSLRTAGAATVLATSSAAPGPGETPREGRTVCLVSVSPERFDPFRLAVLRLANEGAVTRVEAEPHL